MVGFSVLQIRGVLYTLTGHLIALIAVQILDGIGAGIFGVAPVLGDDDQRIFAQILGVGSARTAGGHHKREQARVKSFLQAWRSREDAMNRIRGTTVIMGLCVALAAGAAWAESSPFVGRWHWNRAQSTLPPGEPPPNDVISEISRADGDSVTWSVTIVAPDGQPHVVTLEAGADGESHRISSDTTASVRLIGSGLQTTFTGPAGRSDVQTCTVSADHQRMTCKGVLTDGAGHTASYVDLYDRM